MGSNSALLFRTGCAIQLRSNRWAGRSVRPSTNGECVLCLTFLGARALLARVHRQRAGTPEVEWRNTPRITRTSHTHTHTPRPARDDSRDLPLPHACTRKTWGREREGAGAVVEQRGRVARSKFDDEGLRLCAEQGSHVAVQQGIPRDRVGAWKRGM